MPSRPVAAGTIRPGTIAQPTTRPGGTLTRPVPAPAGGPTTEPNLVIRGTVSSKNEYSAQLPVPINMTITLEDGLVMQSVPVSRSAGAVPRMSAAVSARMSEPEIQPRPPSGSQPAPSRPPTTPPTGPGTTLPPPTDLPHPPDEPEAEVYDVHAADVFTGADGDFEYVYDLPQSVRNKLTSRVKCTVELQALVPGAHLRTVEATAWGAGSAAKIEELNAAFDDIAYRIDFSNTVRRPLVLKLGDDPATTAHFADGASFAVELHHQPANPVVLPGLGQIRHSAPEIWEAPMQAPSGSGDMHVGGVYIEDQDRIVGEFHYEIVDRDRGHTVVRTAPMAGDDTDEHTWGFVQKLEIDVGAGQIGGSLPDRHFKLPFILKDLDLDLYDGEIRIRGQAGIGTGANMVLFTVASFDVRLGLSLRNWNNYAYTDGQLSQLFDVSVKSTSVDALPGTDIDDLPVWFWVALAPIAPALSGWAAIVAGIEALAEPFARNTTESSVLSILGSQSVAAKEAEWAVLEQQLSDLSDEERAELDSSFWFETDSLSVNQDGVHIEAFAGILTNASLAGRFLALY
jgi:hypothetical protein